MNNSDFKLYENNNFLYIYINNSIFKFMVFKSFLEEQLAAERLRYENDISQLASHYSNIKFGSLSRQSSVDSIIKMDETDTTQKVVTFFFFFF